jgi:hypothetical protein
VYVIVTEFEDAGLMLLENSFDIYCRAIAQADPDDLGWESEQEAPLMKIGILGHDNEAVIAGKSPNYRVICVPQAHEAHMGRTGIGTLQCSHQARR